MIRNKIVNHLSRMSNGDFFSGHAPARFFIESALKRMSCYGFIHHDSSPSFIG